MTTRRLAAILAADVLGYSRLMHEDEEATHAQLNSIISGIIDPVVRRHGGRIVKTTGDGFLAEFPSAVEAVRGGVEFQVAIARVASTVPPARRMLFRVGINVGDVIVEEDDIYGDHVNLAARLEQLAEPGSILISHFVYDYVKGRIACEFEDTGEQYVKNIARPVRAYRVSPAAAIVPTPGRTIAGTRVGQAPVLSLSLFGPVSLWFNNREVPLKSLKARAVLGYVALGEASRETRERLVGLLWSESSEEQARAVLRQVVRELRVRMRAAGYDGLRISPHEIGFEPGSVEIDALAVLTAAEAGEVHPMLLERRLLLDNLFAGLEDLDPAFRSWLIAKRHTLHDRLLHALETAIADARPGSRNETRLALALVNLDPTHEDACRRLMRARALAGDVAGALRIYKDLCDLLADEYDMEPAAATQALVAEIKTGALAPALADPRVGAPVSPASPRGETRLEIFVLAVATQEVEPSKAHLVTGFRQHLIASLVRFREWQVADAPYEDQPAIGTGGTRGRYDLRIDVHQDCSALNVLLTMKELETNLYIWSDRFELRLANWFDSQRRIVQRIALALQVHVSAERLRRFSEHPDVPLSIYDRWLSCQTVIRTFDPLIWDSADAHFKDIIAVAPNFVPAYCGLADMHNAQHIVHPGRFRSREHEARALEYARKAVQLDPSDMRAHRSLAWAYSMAKHYTQAVMHIETACELNPNDSWTLISSALLLAFCGQGKRSNDLAQVALDLALAPGRTHWAYCADIRFLNGDYEAALDAADRAQDVLWAVPAWRAAALAHLGRMREAATEASRFLDRVRANWFGPAPASDEAIVRWVLHSYPISGREDWERFRDGLKGAGLPAADVNHHDW
jgi:class 3 adenylate cyclase/DNA-binding SARP family transcriptional activator